MTTTSSTWRQCAATPCQRWVQGQQQYCSHACRTRAYRLRRSAEARADVDRYFSEQPASYAHASTLSAAILEAQP